MHRAYVNIVQTFTAAEAVKNQNIVLHQQIN